MVTMTVGCKPTNISSALLFCILLYLSSISSSLNLSFLLSPLMFSSWRTYSANFLSSQQACISLALRAPYHARMARRAQHLRCYVREAKEWTTGWITRALRFVGLQPTVIASRAPHLLLEQSVMNRGRASPVNLRCERGVLSKFRAARTCASYWFDNQL